MPGHISGHDHEGHVATYTDDDFLMDGLSRFIGGALAVGDAAVVIATESHQRKLEKRLSARGLDTVKAKRQGRYCTLDAAQTLPDSWKTARLTGRASRRLSVDC